MIYALIQDYLTNNLKNPKVDKRDDQIYEKIYIAD